MEERLNLREFQTRLAERLKGAARQDGESSKLGFVAGGKYWLTDLDQVSEVVSVDRFSRAPWAQPWFLGVAGVRGTIFGCTDLGAFLGISEPAALEENRLLLAHPRFGAHAALRIEQALGLRNTTGMKRLPSEDTAAPWVLATYEDHGGAVWTEISIELLLASPRFLQVAA